MAAREKLEEAKHFLDLLDKTPAESQVFDYYLSAYLSAWRSVLDVMLFDFAQSYSLGFNREDRLDESGFMIAARALKRDKALRFLKWWKAQSNRVSRNPLYRVRNMIVHRGTTPLGITIPLTPGSPLPTTNDRVVDTFPVFLSYKKKERQVVVIVGKNLGSKTGTPAPYKLSGIDWRQVEFESIPGREAKVVCKEAFQQMKKIVETAKQHYWRSPRTPNVVEVTGYSVAPRRSK